MHTYTCKQVYTEIYKPLEWSLPSLEFPALPHRSDAVCYAKVCMYVCTYVCICFLNFPALPHRSDTVCYAKVCMCVCMYVSMYVCICFWNFPLYRIGLMLYATLRYVCMYVCICFLNFPALPHRSDTVCYAKVCMYVCMCLCTYVYVSAVSCFTA